MSYRYSNNEINEKIKTYEDRVNKQFLEIAEKLKSDNEADFVILSIATAYIEGNQQFREGKLSENNSKRFFIKGIRRIFDKEEVPEEILRNYYKQIRCGLFHDGITRSNVVVSVEFLDPLRYMNQIIKINPHKFLDKIKEDFKEYIKSVQDEGILRDNFVKRYDLENSLNHQLQDNPENSS